jgi:selenide,water dikinase
MADKSGVELCFFLDRLPFLDGAFGYAAQGLFPGGTCRNKEAYQHGVSFASGISEDLQQLLYTPETSGGLLVSVAPEKLDALMALFEEEEHSCWIVGEVGYGSGVRVLR